MTEPEFETVIGLEVHVQLQLASKLFAPTEYASGGEPNTRVSVIELGLPGVLPALNERAVELAIRAGLALESTIGARVHFDRKNYFYPDLPKGYQITQLDRPLCVGGRVPLGEGEFGALQRIHLEEDAGKSSHHAAGSLVDLNRAGAALIEIVGQPDLRSPEQAFRFLTRLKQILQYAEVSECDMEKGSLRCDANISLRRPGAQQLGTKVELKNLNSFKMVRRALEYEQRRQAAVLGSGGAVRRETRLWNEEQGESAPMRGKEATEDYRYFPEPDLPPLSIPSERVQAIAAAMPELPDARRARFAREFGLPDYDLDVLLDDRHVATYFETVAHGCGDPKLASNWVMTEVLRTLKERGSSVTDLPLTAARLAALLNELNAGRINRAAAKRLFEHLLDHDLEVTEAIAALGLQQLSDPAALEQVVRAVLAGQPAAVADFHAGKQKALHALFGQTMKATGGKANPALVQQLLRKLLESGDRS
ncbi:MAG: Asp-tRNA(Asn)/Glu-tRNA(Gln) amidotransferase subunit GatB [Planctomycetes bacterium]|nr:Asp-tRNA(Asn)/Glu-tRNA(Gln) amidotransferase subunit GatB [Planctomycetota bacterium]